MRIPAKLARPALRLQKASPKIMLVAGVAGVIGAGVMACRSTLKLSETLEPTEKLLELAQDKFERGEYDSERTYKSDLIKLRTHTVLNIAKLYMPAVGVAAVSLSLIIGAQVVQGRRTAAMTAAYAALKEGYDRYRQQVTDEFGEEKDLKLAQGVRVVEETVEGKDGKTKTIKREFAAGMSPYAALFCEGNRNWYPNSDSNWMFLNAQRNYLQNRLDSEGFLFLNDAYEALGLPKTRAGQVVGWIAGTTHGDGYIDFGIHSERSPEVRNFMAGLEDTIWLDFNVDGAVLDLAFRKSEV